MMNLLTMPDPFGLHLCGWRRPDSFEKIINHLDTYVQIAKIAERGKLDGIFIADGNGVYGMDKPALFEANWPANMTGSFEPLTLLSALSQHTRHLGLMGTASTTFEQPYLVARKFASLDMISGGRGGWNVVTSSDGPDAFNFGLERLPDRKERYARCMEFTEVVKGLWDSWAADAFPQNKVTGKFLDRTKVRELNHKGKYFTVKGPLCAARSAQGRPVLYSAGQSEMGRELAARHSDGLFAVANSKEVAMRDYADIKGRMAKYGRNPEQLRIAAYIGLYIGETTSEAQEYFDQLQSMISPEVGLQYLSRALRMDLSGHSVDDPMPEIVGEVVDGYSNRTQMGEVIKRDRPTIRQTYERMIPATGSAYFIGTPKQAADFMEDWYRSGACDGFMVGNPSQPRGLLMLVDRIVPELQRRGLFRKEYPGTTLRETMGVPIPTRMPDAAPATGAA